MDASLFFSAVAAAGAAFASVASIYSIKLSAQNVEAANDTVRLTEEMRIEGERDQRRHRLEHVGELVEQIFWITHDAGAPKQLWMPARNQLGQALIGFSGQLPLCAQVLNAAIPSQAFGAASSARGEVEQALREIDC